MSAELLTPDNPHLPRPKTTLDKAEQWCAIDCKSIITDRVAGLIASSISESTRRAYLSDLAHYKAWGGTVPALPETIAAYLAAHADTLSVATLVRRVATLSKVHEARGFPNPSRSAIVRTVLCGIKRTRGTAQQQARPLLREDLTIVLDRLGGTTKDARDRCLLLLGFAGGFRRSELVGLDRSDVEQVRQGLVLTLRRSKTDQEGAGRKIGIPYGRTRHCPVAAFDDWLEISRIDNGPVLRPVDRHGRVHPCRLSGEAVSLIVRERLASAGIDPTGYSGHSLRSGFATSAVEAGASTLKIRQQTGHASDAMLARYIRGGELFLGNAASLML